MKLKILIATRNRGKLAELERLLSVYIDGAEVELLTLHDVGFTGEIEENGETFAENAMIKAKAAAEYSGLISVGDDSGLCVYALDGEPGVRSARYAGEGHDDAANNAKLLEKLKGVSYREAAFVCAMACVFPQGCGGADRGRRQMRGRDTLPSARRGRLRLRSAFLVRRIRRDLCGAFKG